MTEATQAPEGSKARRVYLLLRDEIAAGLHPAGSSLPGELRLAELHGVSRVTVRRALDALAADGLIERRHGFGLFGMDDPRQGIVHVTGLNRG